MRLSLIAAIGVRVGGGNDGGAVGVGDLSGGVGTGTGDGNSSTSATGGNVSCTPSKGIDAGLCVFSSTTLRIGFGLPPEASWLPELKRRELA